jgi:hypothetical protein
MTDARLRVFENFGYTRAADAGIARDVDVVGAGVFEREPDEFAAALDRRLGSRVS